MIKITARCDIKLAALTRSSTAIRLQIEDCTKRTCSVGALYTTLNRLEEKGLIETWMGNATPQRGGRAKRMVRIRPAA